jgi:hypothetical protein
MKLPFCVACLAKDDLQHHHLITRAEGGGNEETNLITLCAACHHKLHRRQRDGTYSHRERVRAGLARAKDEGKQLRRPRLAPELEGRIRKALSEPGRPGVRVIAERFGISPGSAAQWQVSVCMCLPS